MKEGDRINLMLKGKYCCDHNTVSMFPLELEPLIFFCFFCLSIPSVSFVLAVPSCLLFLS